MLNTQLPEQSGAAQAYLLGSFQKLAAFPGTGGRVFFHENFYSCLQRLP